eukprot:TRINITY_DN8023_c0_g1_i1.p1 TRINITY_DN8023_c0_g1~~TRINITY_DN8023_c0_g1_i1.p1  ORF type:complete len:362 (+),score=84.70 TRINITY_DN8023_c0_g1_i1:121-1086(+)
MKVLKRQAQDKPSPKSQMVSNLMKKCLPLIGTVLKLVDVVTPYVEQVIALGLYVHGIVPLDMFISLFGLGLCFFGGTYAVSIAAVEAYMMVGFEDTKKAVAYLYYEFKKVKEAYVADDAVDEDNDGIADVLQIDSSQLLVRKTMLFFASIEDPEQVTKAWGGIVSGFLAVLATLKIEFAKVITLGTAIGNFLRKPASYILVPILAPILGEKYDHWLNVIINTLCKLIAVSIAWSVQKIVSAVHSSIKGGLMFSRHIIIFLNKKGYLTINHEETYVDEVVGWGVALIGLWFQLSNFFSLPFPWNIILFPVTVCEWVLIWLIS